MKQHHLSTKFLVFYIFIGVFGFFLVTLGGSYMVERHFEHSLSAALYTEAHNIASNEAVKNNISSATVDSLCIFIVWLNIIITILCHILQIKNISSVAPPVGCVSHGSYTRPG